AFRAARMLPHIPPSSWTSERQRARSRTHYHRPKLFSDVSTTCASPRNSAVWVLAFARTSACGGATDVPQTSPSRRVRDDAVAAVVLGAVERVVGALEHVADRLALLFQRGNADRDRDLDALGALVDRERLARDGTAQALGDHACDVKIGLRH